MHSVIIVDQDPMVSYLIRGYVEKDGGFCVAGEFRKLKSALAFLDTNDVDLMILDLCVPDYDGGLLEKALLNESCETYLIVVTAARDAGALQAAAHLGAVDYLVKPFSCERLKEALGRYADHEQTVRGLRSVDQETVDYLLHAALGAETGCPKGTGGMEQRILEYMEDRPGQDVTVKELAGQLTSSVVTVRRYLKRLADAGRVVADIDYHTGGHPRVRYRLP